MLEVYYYEDSICAEKVLMLLAEKSVDDWVHHPIHLFKGEQFHPDYLKLNPKAQVPTIVHDGEVIRESSIICDYLDDLYPKPALKPSGAVQTAHMREWVKEVDESAFEAVASLSFIAVFRGRLLAMSDAEREAYWDAQTAIDRTMRQKSCVFEGADSPYVMRAIGAWERIFTKMEKTLADGRDWLIGDQFSLVEINFAPLVARCGKMHMLSLWLEDRPLSQAWWERLQAWPSFSSAKVGGSDPVNAYDSEGLRVREQLQAKLGEYRAKYGT